MLSPTSEPKWSSNWIKYFYNILQYKDEDESGLNLDDLSDDENDEISIGSELSTEAAENVKAIAVENSFMEVRQFWFNCKMFCCLWT